MPDLTFEDVSITYAGAGGDRGDVRAVKNVSLSLPAGSTLGIAGESGSGKTTLVMSVLRLLPSTAKLTGRVTFGDRDIAELTFGEMRAVRWAEASIIFQGAMHSLNPVRTVGHQINEALELHVTDRWSTPKARRERVAELLGLVDLPADKAESYPHELSGGQKQRVMIAMALACDPDVIIADEPTTALDVIVQKQILDMIAKLVVDRGISMLMISHDLSVLATACERVGIMRDGELIEIGPAAEVTLHPKEPYSQKLAAAFPVIGDPESRMRPITRHLAETLEGEGEEVSADALGPLDGAADAPAEDAEVLLEAQDVSVAYDVGGYRVPAVRNVDLRLRRGEIMALVGQSGSGKSTLARTLLGLQPADSGTVRFKGEPLPTTARGLKALRKDAQLVFQDPTAALNPKLSIYESVAEGLRIHRYQGDERERVAQALSDAELTPPERYFGAIPQELSGGQRQRVVIAGALALEPELLIADEPVASLDASVRGEILGLLLSLRRRLGVGALVITHDLGLAWNIADTVAVMLRGEIVEQGPTEEVLLRPQHEYTQQLLDAAPSIAEGAA